MDEYIGIALVAALLFFSVPLPTRTSDGIAVKAVKTVPVEVVKRKRPR